MRIGWDSTKKRIKKLLRRSVVDPLQDTELLAAAGFRRIDDTEPDDVFLVGYPKSGNTWMQNLVAGVLYGIDTTLLCDKLTQLIVPNVHGVGFYKRLTHQSFFKSHALPCASYRRVIYLVRDGRDAMVSYYHMLNAVCRDSVDLFAMVNSGQGLFPCKWHEHIQQWTDNPFQSDMMFVRYEDLQSDPVGELQRVCEFAGLSRNLETIQRCVQGNSFSNMQAKENNYGWDNSNWNSEKRFVRRGIVGSYKDEMPAEIVRLFDGQSRRQLTQFGYDVSTQTVC